MDQKSQNIICTDFSKWDYKSDPTDRMMEANKHFNERIFLADEMLKVKDPIELSVDDFCSVVKILSTNKLTRLDVKEVLKRPSKSWPLQT